MSIDKQTLLAWRGLAEKATAGPWFLGYRCVCSEPISREYQRIESGLPIDMPDEDPRWDELPNYDVCSVPVVAGDTPTKQGAYDGEFIAASRDALPRLIEALEDRNAYYNELIEAYREQVELVNKTATERDSLRGELVASNALANIANECRASAERECERLRALVEEACKKANELVEELQCGSEEADEFNEDLAYIAEIRKAAIREASEGKL